MNYTFGFLRDYASARGLSLERGNFDGHKYRLGNPLCDNWKLFATLDDVRDYYVRWL